jgi:hypothetical protein
VPATPARPWTCGWQRCPALTRAVCSGLPGYESISFSMKAMNSTERRRCVTSYNHLPVSHSKAPNTERLRFNPGVGTAAWCPEPRNIHIERNTGIKAISHSSKHKVSASLGARSNCSHSHHILFLASGSVGKVWQGVARSAPSVSAVPKCPSDSSRAHSKPDACEQVRTQGNYRPEPEDVTERRGLHLHSLADSLLGDHVRLAWPPRPRAVVQPFHPFGFKPLDPSSDRSHIALKDVSDLGHGVPLARQQDHPDTLRDPAYLTASQAFQVLTLLVAKRSNEHHWVCSSRGRVAYPLHWKSATYFCKLT